MDNDGDGISAEEHQNNLQKHVSQNLFDDQTILLKEWLW
jgi:hypothetical protein